MMQSNIPQKAEQYAKKQGRYRVWQRIVLTLACAVVFCTTYALIIPAITMERAPSCGFENHQHTEFCYEVRSICGVGEAHTHSDGCYTHQQLLVCTQEESSGHIHSDSCIHTEQILACTQEHEHAPECFTASTTYVCATAEGEGAHTHTQQCYETQSTLTCTIPEQQPHVHTDECYEKVLICRKEVHSHSDDCYPPVTEATEQTTAATVETTIATEETTIATEETTIATEETTIATEETTQATEDPTEETQEQTEPEEVPIPELELYVTDVFFSDTVYNAAADRFDTVMHVSFRIPLSVISVGELYACNYQLPGNLTPVMWGPSNFYFGSARASSGVRAGSFVFTYEGGHCLSVLSFDRNAISGDAVEGNFSFAAAISPSALQEDGAIRLTLSNGVGVSIPAPEMPAAETEPTEETTEATEETTEITEETTEATEETTDTTDETTDTTDETTEPTGETTDTTEEPTESTQETTESTEETTDTTEETTEATEETTELTRKSIKGALRDLIGLGASPAAINETGGTTVPLPNVVLSGNNAKFIPETDRYSVAVRIDFRFDGTTGNPDANTTYSYTYPGGVVVPESLLNQDMPLIDKEGVNAGTYRFIPNADGTYSVLIEFDPNYINTHNNNVQGFVWFTGSFTADNVDEEGNIVVGNDELTVLVPGDKIQYPANETEDYHIGVQKEGCVQDGDKLKYTVKVFSARETPGPVTVTDHITTPEGLELGNPEVVTVRKGKCTYFWDSSTKTWKWGQNVGGMGDAIDYLPTYVENNLTLTLDPLQDEPDYHKGQYYEITYTYPITDQTISSVSPQNTVNVSTTDAANGRTLNHSAETTVTVYKDISYTIRKSGAFPSDRDGYIKWEVIVNENEVNIAGATLTDTLFDDLSVLASDVTYNPNSGYTATTDSNGKITGITFNAGEDGKNKNQYTITYYTKAEVKWNDTEVPNTATFDPDPAPDKPDDEKKDTAKVTVPGVQLKKTGQFNGATDQIDWTITVNSGNLDIAGATLTDGMFAQLTNLDAVNIAPSNGYEGGLTADGKRCIKFKAVTEDGKNTQRYTIRYSTAVQPGSTTPVTNTAVLSHPEGAVGPIPSEYTVNPGELKLDKSGSFNWNDGINWTVIVNADRLNIAGAELTDGMFGELSPNGFTITKNGDENVPNGEYTVTSNANGKIEKIRFNGSGDPPVNTNQYTITYTTTEYCQWEDHNVTNTATLDLSGKTVTDTEEVPIPRDGYIQKGSSTGSVSEDGKTMTIPWTVTLGVPKGGLPAGATIVDDVTRRDQWNTNSNQWMTRAQILDWGTNLTWTDDSGNPVGGSNTYTSPPEQVTFLASDGNRYTYKQINEHTPPEGSGTVNYGELKYTIFTISFPEGLTPPNDAAKRLTFTYFTTVDLTQASPGENKFYNYVKVGSQENGAEYTYRKPGVIKTDGSDRTENTTVNNEGELTWKIKVNVGEKNSKKLTLIDTLPQGVTLESLQLTGQSNLNMTLNVAANGAITGTDSTNQYVVSGTFANGVITLNIVRPDQNTAIQNQAEFTLTVTCQVVDAANTGTKTLTNKAEAKLDEIPIGSPEQTQEWTYYKEDVVSKVVDKSGSWDGNNRIMNYTVVLNPESSNLLEDLEGVGNLTLVDNMTHSIRGYVPSLYAHCFIRSALIHGSVQLYTAELREGVWVPVAPVDWNWTYNTSVPIGEWGYVTHTITATGIPDSTPLILRYSYRFSADGLLVGDEYFGFDVSNNAKLSGSREYNSSHSSTNSWESVSHSGGVTADKSYTFYKVEEGDYGVPLQGAKFSVYNYNDEVMNIPVREYTTNDRGTFQILREEKDTGGNVTFAYAYNTLYKVKETAPPAGYNRPNPVPEYVFYFSSTDPNAPAGLSNDAIPSGAVDLSAEAKTVFVENAKTVTSIEVKKEWKNADGTVADPPADAAISYELWRGTESSPAGEKVGQETYTLGTANNWRNSHGNLDVKNGSGEFYQYFVKEITAPEGYTVTYANNHGIRSGTITITNTKQPEVTSITVNKQWLDSTGQTIAGNAESLPGTIAFYLTRTANGTTERVGSDGVIGSAAQSYTLTKANGWTMTIENLPLKDSQGSTYAYSVEEVTVAGYSSAVSVNGTTITITNTQTPAPTPTALTVNKVWKNANGTELTPNEGYSVTVNLARVAATTTGGTSSQRTLRSTTEKKSQWTFTDAELNDPNLSLCITYKKIKEGYLDYGYAAICNTGWENLIVLNTESGSATGTYSSTVPLINLPRGINNFIVNFWGSVNGEDVYATLVSVELIETVITGGQTTTTVIENYKTQVLTSANNWSHTWTNLPAGDSSTTYTYYVTEAGVTNGSEENFANLFNVSVDHGDREHTIGPSGTVTVTNTLKSTYTLPETGGGGAKPYTLGGLLLCITAGALLLYNHPRRRKEVFPSS